MAAPLPFRTGSGTSAVEQAVGTQLLALGLLRKPVKQADKRKEEPTRNVINKFGRRQSRSGIRVLVLNDQKESVSSPSRLQHARGGAADPVIEHAFFNVDSFHNSIFNHHRIAL